MFVLPLSRAAARPALSSAIDRLFDDSFDRFIGTAVASAKPRTPAMDVSESDDAYTLVLDVPGTTREQLKVSVEGRRVSVVSDVSAAPAVAAAAEKDAAPKAAPRVLYRERTAPSYARTVVLPTEVDQAQSQARFENGVLTLTLSKRVPTGATQLTIA